MSWKISSLVRSEILGPFGNTLTADHMDSGHRWEKVREKVQTILSQKRSIHFPEFLLHFRNLHKMLIILEKKDELHSLNISEVIDPDKCGYVNSP